jgi:hypothetical protein
MDAAESTTTPATEPHTAAETAAIEGKAARQTAYATEWTAIAPGGDTICSDGTPYQFFVRKADPARLLVYFQGGGACWFAENCATHLQPSYKINVHEDTPPRASGIFDFTHSDNPFRDYSVVMAPYCTGDVHIGDNTATYDAPARDGHEAQEITIHHRGFVNANAVLDWTYAHFAQPSEVFVTGSSAGAIPSPYYAWKIADRYPDARVAQLGDAAGGYRRSGSVQTMRLDQWGTFNVLGRYPELSELDPAEFTYEHLYIVAGQRRPDMRLAAFDNAEDAVQKRFLAMAGTEADVLVDLIDANQADIREAIDNFRSYVAGGDAHTVLLRNEFYTLETNGVRFRDWVTDLASDRDVADIRCDQCQHAEFAERR